jgi:beta-glucanase (GH16 family)
MLPVSYESRPEIDIMEILGHQTTTQNMAYHYLKPGGALGDSSADWMGPDFAADWHTFAVDWRPEAIVWYVDGVERWRYADRATISSEPSYLLLNLAVGGDWPGPPDGSTPFPSTLDVEYVRVWKPASAVTPTTTTTTTTTTTPTVSPTMTVTPTGSPASSPTSTPTTTPTGTPTVTPTRTVTPTPSPTQPSGAAPSVPSPDVVVSTSRAGPNRLLVSVTPRAGQTIDRLDWTVPANAAVEALDGTPLPDGLTLAPGAAGASFSVRRLSRQSVTLPIVVSGSFGTWRTFVGGGPDAW